LTAYHDIKILTARGYQVLTIDLTNISHETRFVTRSKKPNKAQVQITATTSTATTSTATTSATTTSATTTITPATMASFVKDCADLGALQSIQMGVKDRFARVLAVVHTAVPCKEELVGSKCTAVRYTSYTRHHIH
jgi:hypothetical protein